MYRGKSMNGNDTYKQLNLGFSMIFSKNAKMPLLF